MFIFQIVTGNPPPVSPLPEPPESSSLPIPLGGPNSSLPQPSSSPIDDFAGAAVNAETQRRLVQQRGELRHNTPIAAAMNSIGAITFNNDGSYSRPNDTGRYFYQIDNSIFYTGGLVNHPGGRIETLSPSTYRNGLWNSSPENNTALAGTFATARLDLISNGDGSFRRAGDGNAGRYFLQQDGSVFFEGGTVNGVQTQARTNVNGNWDSNRNTIMPGTLNFARLGLVPLSGNLCRVPGPQSDLAYVLNDGRILTLSPIAGDLRVFTYNNGTFTQVADRNGNNHADAEIQTGIRAILASRTGRYGNTDNIPLNGVFAATAHARTPVAANDYFETETCLYRHHVRETLPLIDGIRNQGQFIRLLSQFSMMNPQTGRRQNMQIFLERAGNNADENGFFVLAWEGDASNNTNIRMAFIPRSQMPATPGFNFMNGLFNGNDANANAELTPLLRQQLQVFFGTSPFVNSQLSETMAGVDRNNRPVQRRLTDIVSGYVTQMRAHQVNVDNLSLNISPGARENPPLTVSPNLAATPVPGSPPQPNFNPPIPIPN